MIRETTNDTMPQDKYDLADFQALVLKYGPNYFNPNNNNPFQYFQVLVYSQQFERVKRRPFYWPPGMFTSCGNIFDIGHTFS